MSCNERISGIFIIHFMLFLYYHQQLQQSLKAALVLFFFENIENFLLYDILLKFIPISRMGE